MEIYLVRPGDSMAGLAQRFDLSGKALARRNQLNDTGRLTPGLSLVVPGDSPRERPGMECCASLGPGTAPADTAALLPRLSWLCCPAASFTAGGDLQCPDNTALLQAAGQQHTVPLLTLANLSESGHSALLAHSLLCSSQGSSTLLDNVLSAMKRQGYLGLHLSFQYLFPFDKDAYSRFAELAAERFHAQGYYLFVSLAPKTAALAEAPLCAAHDYARLGACADRLLLLGHGWGGRFTAPQAIAPVDQLQSVLAYARQQFPAGKLLLSLSSQGCNWALPWRQGEEARPLSSALAVSLAVSAGAEIRFDHAAQAPFFIYTDALKQRRIVWYEDGRSLLARLSLAREQQLAGISLWVNGRLYRPGLALLWDSYSLEKLL